MYIDLSVITFGIGIILGIVIHIALQFAKSQINAKRTKSGSYPNKILGESSGIINDSPTTKPNEKKSIDLNIIIRDCLEFHLENDNLTQILNASACESIKCSIKAIADHVKLRFNGYVTANFYMYDISFIYELSDNQIDNAIDAYVADYIGKRKKVQEKILIALNTEVGVEVDPRLKDKSFTNIKTSLTRSGELDEVDIFREAGFYSTNDGYDVRF